MFYFRHMQNFPVQILQWSLLTGRGGQLQVRKDCFLIILVQEHVKCSESLECSHKHPCHFPKCNIVNTKHCWSAWEGKRTSSLMVKLQLSRLSLHSIGATTTLWGNHSHRTNTNSKLPKKTGRNSYLLADFLILGGILQFVSHCCRRWN